MTTDRNDRSVPPPATVPCAGCGARTVPPPVAASDAIKRAWLCIRCLDAATEPRA